MKKKVFGILLAGIMALGLFGCGSSGNSTAGNDSSTASGTTSGETVNSDFKVGAIMLGDETESYTKAHMDGINAAVEALGLSSDNVIWKYKVPEDSSCADAAVDLIGQGCQLIISNSYGHQTYMASVAIDYPDVQFVAMTGDFAAISGMDNLKNAFTNIYEARYVSGVVAGLKLQEILEDGTLTPGDAAQQL